jgi:hypothetical protein
MGGALRSCAVSERLVVLFSFLLVVLMWGLRLTCAGCGLTEGVELYRPWGGFSARAILFLTKRRFIHIFFPLIDL